LVGVANGEDGRGWLAEEREQSSMKGMAERGTSLTSWPDHVMLSRCSCLVTTNRVPSFWSCAHNTRKASQASMLDSRYRHVTLGAAQTRIACVPRHHRVPCNQLHREACAAERAVLAREHTREITCGQRREVCGHSSRART
jgi:hypothetical protein